MRVRAILLAALLGCAGDTGTIAVSIVTAPDSTLMDQVQRARLTLSNPYEVIEAERRDGELRLALEVVADGAAGLVTFEGFDADDTLVAFGRTGPLPVAAIDADIAIYVAPPLSIARAPVDLEPARSELGITQLSYGVALAGGRLADGSPADELVIYNVYDHAFQVGEPLPQARARPVVMTGGSGVIYVVGGEDDTGAARASGWRFDTAVPPAGVYADLMVDASFAVTGATADGAPLGREQFVITGAPPLLLDGLFSQVGRFPDAPDDVTGTAGTTVVDNQPLTLITGPGLGTSGALLLQGGQFVDLEGASATARTGHEIVAIEEPELLVVGGVLASDPDGAPSGSAVRFDPLRRELRAVDLLDTPRKDAAIAATGEHVLVAGGVDADGAVVGTAEVFAADTLAPVATLPLLVPRTGALARPLANGQILIIGGVDADGAPIATIELFTP